MYTAQGKFDHSGLSDLLKQYAPMVRRLALQLIAKLPANVELDDLIQVGMIGLMDAANRYLDDQNATFETYASQRIRGAMLDELRANDWVPRGLRQSSRGVSNAIQIQEQKLGRAPTEGEIAQEMQLSLESYQHLLHELQGCQLLYFEDFDRDDDENSFMDRQQPTQECLRDDPLTLLLESDFRRQLIDAIDRIPERERLLLSLYYQEEFNLREIGAILGVKESRACQLHSQAIGRLRAALLQAQQTQAA